MIGYENKLKALDLSLTKGLTEIPDHAFLERASLSSITLPLSLERIGEAAFRQTGLKRITIPRNVGSIAAAAFRTQSLDCMIFEGVLPAELSTENSPAPIERKLVINDLILDGQGHNMDAFLPNIDSESVAQTYKDVFAENHAGVKVYYNYTGGVDGDKADATKYTLLN